MHLIHDEFSKGREFHATKGLDGKRPTLKLSKIAQCI
jgi:hypothetical protein